MHQEHEQLDRRGFLRLSGAGAAIAGTKILFPSLLSAEEQPVQLTDRTLPVNPVRLCSSEMEVVLDRNDGVPFAFHLLANATLRGEDFGKKISATLCQKSPWKFMELETSPTSIKATPTAADFLFDVNSGGVKVGSFRLAYVLHEATVVVTLEDVKDSPGYELISIALPRLVTVREEDPDAWLVSWRCRRQFRHGEECDGRRLGSKLVLGRCLRLTTRDDVGYFNTDVCAGDHSLYGWDFADSDRG